MWLGYLLVIRISVFLFQFFLYTLLYTLISDIWQIFFFSTSSHIEPCYRVPHAWQRSASHARSKPKYQIISRSAEFVTQSIWRLHLFLWQRAKLNTPTLMASFPFILVRRAPSLAPPGDPRVSPAAWSSADRAERSLGCWGIRITMSFISLVLANKEIAIVKLVHNIGHRVIIKKFKNIPQIPKWYIKKYIKKSNKKVQFKEKKRCALL